MANLSLTPGWLPKPIRRAILLLAGMLSLSGLTGELAPSQITTTATDIPTSVQQREQTLSALEPYTAYYRMHHNGLSADAKRSLQNIGNGQWRLSQTAKLFFIKVSEESLLSSKAKSLYPMSYQYENSISSGQNQKIQFNWENGTVSDQVYRTPGKLAMEAG